MEKHIFILLAVLHCYLYAWPQNKQSIQFKGRVVDKESRAPLQSASVLLLRTKDSATLQSTFTDEQGRFAVSFYKDSSYILKFNYIGYQSEFHTILPVIQQGIPDLGTISMQKAGLMLATVEIVENKPPIIIKKDTIEYNAAYFKTRENALIEELLKQLPGIQIEDDGSININGKKVKRLLINGKPYFSDDPTLATRNIAADIVEKVQLINNAEENIQSTGINDREEKAINITIKENKKKTWLGRLVAGYGTTERFGASGSLQQFTDNQQLALLGKGDNLNGYAEGRLSDMKNGSGGITRNWSGGINYNRTLSKKLEINASYLINKIRQENLRSSARQNILPDTTYYYNQYAMGKVESNSHNWNLWAEYKIDSMQSLIVMSQYGRISSDNLQESKYESLDADNQLVNQGIMKNTFLTSTPDFSTTLFFNKKFQKIGRSFRARLEINYNGNNRQGFNQSNNIFIKPDSNSLADTINQHDDIDISQQKVHFQFAYTEPINREGLFLLMYAYTRNQNSSNYLTYDFDITKLVYDDLNDTLSNVFKNIGTSHSLYMCFRIKKERCEYELGLNLLLNHLFNYNYNQMEKITRNWFYVFPTSSFGYKFSNYKSLFVQYMGRVVLPDIVQLQPVYEIRILYMFS